MRHLFGMGKEGNWGLTGLLRDDGLEGSFPGDCNALELGLGMGIGGAWDVLEQSILAVIAAVGGRYTGE